MNNVRLSWLWRSFRGRAMATAALSLALVIAILFVFSTTWLNRSQLEVQDRRSRELMRNLAARLDLGVLVRSPDLIRPIVQDALVNPEVREIAVLDASGNVLVHLPESTNLLSNHFGSVASTKLKDNGTTIASEPWQYWVLAASIEVDSSAASGATPADFQIVESTNGRRREGTVLVYWDLEPSALWLGSFKKRFLIYSCVAFALVAVPTWLLTHYLNRGVYQLFEATQHVRRGNLRFHIGSRRTDELGDVMRAFDAMTERTAQMTQELEMQRQNALSASRAKSEFLANMSHELRTPLNAIIGFSEVLLEPVFGELTEKQRSYVVDVLESGRHLLSLINDILDLAKIESGKMELEHEQVDLTKLLGSSLRLIAERAAKHGIELSLDVAEDVQFIDADQRKLKQVVYNLLSNAVKFTPDGGRVGIRAHAQGESIRISVWDTGIGIPASEHEEVFHDFYQVGDPMVKSQQGTGLGLSLVRKLVELHGGRVWVESEVGVGSEFVVDLPLRAASDHSAERLVAASA